MRKKIALFLVAAMTAASLVACGNSAEKTSAPAQNDAAATESETASTENEAAPAETEADSAEGAETPAEGGTVAVFYYTYGDTYI